MTIQITYHGEVMTLPLLPGQTVLAVLREGGIPLGAPCGGKGICGKCTVFLRCPEGEVAICACRTPGEDGMCLRIPEETMVLLDTEERNMAGNRETGYGLACDLGTTTVACSLIDRRTGQCLDTVGQANAQGAYGADVMRRIEASMDGKTQNMTVAIQHQLRDMVRNLMEQNHVAPEEIQEMSVAANTTMCHLLVGKKPDSMGVAPYVPEHTFGDFYEARKLQLPFDGQVYVAPGVSAFVGGDITADILAADMDIVQEDTLLMDIGTNGELVLGRSGRFLCCATAAGPAFEGTGIRYGMTAAPGAITQVQWRRGQVECSVMGGGPARGICGSGLVDGLAMLRQVGAIDATGRMLHPDEDVIPEELEPYLYLIDGAPAFCLMDEVAITQGDVRALQLCKGAIAAGIQILELQWGQPIRRVLLAGGFGNSIRPESGAKIGLFPQRLLPATKNIGNAALLGARMALCESGAKERLEEIRNHMTYLSLSGNPEFQKYYMEQQYFPE